MRTRIDVDDYTAATPAQRAAVDAYFAAIGRPLKAFHVIAAEATAEGTVRVERYVCAPGRRCGGVVIATGPCTHDFLKVRETLRPTLPPPWLAWPEEADPCE